VGNIACSALIPRLPDQRFIALATGALLAIAYTGLLAAPQAALLWAGIAGFGGGASLVLALSLFGLRTPDAVMAAKLSGMAQSIGYTIAALGPIVIGALFDLTRSWTPSLLLLIGAAVLQAVAGVLASRPRTI